jgi:type IV secretory pathway TrbD component
MSFGDRLVLWLHIAFAIFTIGPVALAISSTPRAIRHRDIPVLRYLSRITLIFTAASLLVLVFGIVLGNIVHAFSRPWLTVSMTLFVVAIVLLVLIARDQRKAIRAIGDLSPGDRAAGTAGHLEGVESSQSGDDSTGQHAAEAAHIASVERGRIAALGGVVNLLWLVILVLMVWRP